MIVVKKRKFGLVAIQKWFPTEVKFLDSILISMYKQVDLNTPYSFLFKKESSYTLHSDLLLSDEEIMKRFSSTIRNEIRRAEREGSIYNNSTSVDCFLTIFNDFAIQKGLAIQSIESLKSFNSSLVLTSTSINNEITATHSYLIDLDNRKVRLLHSATQRFSENIDTNMIARSNKYLHYMDMKMFKSQGYETYDWGGIAFGSENKSLLGINKFKESFGGQLIEQYNLYSPIYLLIMKLFK